MGKVSRLGTAPARRLHLLRARLVAPCGSALPGLRPASGISATAPAARAGRTTLRSRRMTVTRLCEVVTWPLRDSPTSSRSTACLPSAFSLQALGADYSGQWADASTLVVTAIDVAGAGPPRINATSGTRITVSGELRNSPRTRRTLIASAVLSCECHSSLLWPPLGAHLWAITPGVPRSRLPAPGALPAHWLLAALRSRDGSGGQWEAQRRGREAARPRGTRGTRGPAQIADSTAPTMQARAARSRGRA